MNNQEKTSFWKKMAVIGPAAILVSSSMGPGTIASCIMGGSHLGYKILWMVAASGFLGAVVSLVGGRVYAVTGKAGFEIVRDYTHKYFAYPFFAWMIFAVYYVIAIEGNLLAHTTSLIVPQIKPYIETIAIPVIVVIIALIFTFGFKRVVFLCAIMTFFMAILFLINIFSVDVSWSGMAKGLIPAVPLDKTGLMAFGGILGGSAGGVVAVGYSYLVKNKGWNRPEFIKRMTLDQVFFYGILFGIFSIGIYVSGAAVLYTRGIEVTSAIDAAKALEPLVGPFSKWIFLVGLFMSIFTTIGALAIMLCYFLADMVGIPPDLDDTRFKLILFISILVAILGPFLSGLPAMQYMVYAMVILLLAGPLIIGIYLYVANSKQIMGNYTNSWVFNLILFIALVLNCIGGVAAFIK